MHLFIVFLAEADRAPMLAERLEGTGARPTFVRGRSAAAVLEADVPIFAGLRSLAQGADEDRLLAIWLSPVGPEEIAGELEKVRAALEEGDSPLGSVVALGALAPRS